MLIMNSETSRLLPDVENSSQTPQTGHLKLKRRIILLLYAFSVFMNLADNLQPAALIQVFENVICDEQYRTLLESNDKCKSHAVQKELALVRGFYQLMPLFAGLTCTVPYGLLAERIGRKRVLILSGAGMFASLSWVLAVCYWQFASIRWVLLSGVFLFIGGGDAVTTSVVHVMLTDVADQAERAQIFLYLHAAGVISGFFGPAISAVLMEKGYAWTVLLLACGITFFSTFILVPFIPETINLRNKPSRNTRPTDEPSSPRVAITDSEPSELSVPGKIANSIASEISSLLAPLLSILTSNRQAVLLLFIFGPQIAARELFNMIGLQYSNAKYSLSYARGNILLTLFQGGQGLFILSILPLINRLIAEPRSWTAWARDRIYAIVAISVTASGLFVIAVAPVLTVEAVGLILLAFGGSSTSGLLMSLIGGAVRPSQVSAVYSAALMLSIAIRSLIGPVSAALLVKGMDFGWNWIGLPFAVMAVLMVGTAVASGFIKPEVGGHSDED